LPEFLSVVVQTGAATHEDLPRLAEEWRVANDRVLELQDTERGFADNPAIADLPSAVHHLAIRAMSDPVFQRSFGLVPARFGLVELDKLVVFQKHIDLAHVRRVQDTISPCPTDEEIFRVCSQPRRSCLRREPGRWLRTRGIRVPVRRFAVPRSAPTHASEVPGLVTAGRPTHVLMLGVGFGSNYLNAIHVDAVLSLTTGAIALTLSANLGDARSLCHSRGHKARGASSHRERRSRAEHRCLLGWTATVHSQGLL